MKTKFGLLRFLTIITLLYPSIREIKAQDSLYLIGTITGESNEKKIVGVKGVGDVNGDGANDFGSVAPLNNVPELPQDGYFIIFKGDSGYVTGIENNSVPVPKDFNFNKTTQIHLIQVQLSIGN